MMKDRRSVKCPDQKKKAKYQNPKRTGDEKCSEIERLDELHDPINAHKKLKEMVRNFKSRESTPVIGDYENILIGRKDKILF